MSRWWCDKAARGSDWGAQQSACHTCAMLCLAVPAGCYSPRCLPLLCSRRMWVTRMPCLQQQSRPHYRTHPHSSRGGSRRSSRCFQASAILHKLWGRHQQVSFGQHKAIWTYKHEHGCKLVLEVVQSDRHAHVLPRDILHLHWLHSLQHYPDVPCSCQACCVVSSSAVASLPCHVQKWAAELPVCMCVSGKGPAPTSVRLPDGSCVVRRVIPSDNSCLFTAVGYVMEHDRGRAAQLRRVIADAVAADPGKNEARTPLQSSRGTAVSRIAAQVQSQTAWRTRHLQR